MIFDEFFLCKDRVIETENKKIIHGNIIPKKISALIAGKTELNKPQVPKHIMLM